MALKEPEPEKIYTGEKSVPLEMSRHRSPLYPTFTRPPSSVSPEVLLKSVRGLFQTSTNEWNTIQGSYIPETKLKMAEPIRKLWGRRRDTSRGTLALRTRESSHINFYSKFSLLRWFFFVLDDVIDYGNSAMKNRSSSPYLKK